MVARWQGKVDGGGGGPLSFIYDNLIGNLNQCNNYEILIISFLNFLSLAVYLTNWNIYKRIRRIKQNKIL